MPYSFPCDWKSGFVMDPVKKQRVGYLTAFNGIGLSAALAADLSVYSPYNSAAAPTYAAAAPDATTKLVKAVGILENVSWNGGVGDAFTFSCYMSSENANLLKALKSLTLKTTSISSLGWWICNFDEETKQWFEEHHPLAPLAISAQLNAVSKNDIRLHVADEPVKVASNIDVNVYNVYFEIVPAANQTATFHVASSPTKKVALNWGLVVGTIAKGALAAAT
jgi:hypothetical protein